MNLVSISPPPARTFSQPLRVVQLAGRGEVCRSGAFSPDGEHLAVGLSGGGIKIMEFHPQVFQVSVGGGEAT